MLDFSEILNGPSPIKKEPLPSISSEEFVKVVETRRSVRIFDDTPIPEKTVKKCLDLALLAPSASNFCPWEFYWIRSRDVRQAINAYCMSAPMITTAAEVIICVVRTNTWKKHRKAMLDIIESDQQKFPNCMKFYYQKITLLSYYQGWFNIFGLLKGILLRAIRLFTVQPLPPCSKRDMLTWAIKGGALASQNLMLSFRAFGHDTCAIEGFDEKRISKLLHLPKDAHVSLVIGVGNRSILDQRFGPQVRLDRSWYIKEI